LPVLARHEHCQVVALEPLNLLDETRHRRAGGEKARQQRLERSIERGCR
jgi:hypothetical protein